MPVDPAQVRDVVIVVPGIMGSTLVDAADRPVWSLTVGSVVTAIRTLGGSLHGLKLPDGIGDEHPGDGVRAVDLMRGLHVIPGLWSPISGYEGLMAFLRSPRFHLVEAHSADPDRMPNLIAFPYDWRLSNRYNARLLARVACAALERWRTQPATHDPKLVLVCHSMGGLVARWFLEQENGAELTRALVTIGTPHRGALKALVTLANDFEPGLGPLRMKLTPFARSLPSLHQLLPTYDCLQIEPGRRSGLADGAVSALNTSMLDDARKFHAALEAAPTPAYRFHKIVGIRQPTPTTARLAGARVDAADEIDGQNQGGDGTVPRLAAEPFEGRGVEVVEVADQHGELQTARAVLDLLDGILTREEVIWQATLRETFGVAMAELWLAGSRPELFVPDLSDRRLRVRVFDEADREVAVPVFVRPDGSAVLDPLPPGGYRARVESPLPGGPSPVTRPFLMWDPETTIPELDRESNHAR
jgi:pimeloyl-ACP methyl ester carboxylesterase